MHDACEEQKHYKLSMMRSGSCTAEHKSIFLDQLSEEQRPSKSHSLPQSLLLGHTISEENI